MDYYNDNDANAAAWVRLLQEDGHLPNGRVDERSIEDVEAKDLEGFRQVHFFAGIGGWPLALRLAGWPEDRPVWTGSCPCQPFSTAGKAQGVGDERHLWPAFYRLISERHPPIIFGEQVESKDGRYWLAGVRDDLEREGYAVGAADLCAASLQAPHKRQRLYWVAHSEDSNGRPGDRRAEEGTRSEEQRGRRSPGGGVADRVGQPVSPGLEGHAGNGDRGNQPGRVEEVPTRPVAEPSSVGRVEHTSSNRRIERRPESSGRGATSGCGSGGVEYANSAGRKSREQTGKAPRYGDPLESTGFWNDTRIIRDSKGKYRRIPTEPSLFPLAPRVPGRVGLLRGAGGSIVPQVAAEFIRAYLETEVI